MPNNTNYNSLQVTTARCKKRQTHLTGGSVGKLATETFWTSSFEMSRILQTRRQDASTLMMFDSCVLGAGKDDIVVFSRSANDTVSVTTYEISPLSRRITWPCNVQNVQCLWPYLLTIYNQNNTVLRRSVLTVLIKLDK